MMGGFFLKKRAEGKRKRDVQGKEMKMFYNNGALPVQLFSCGDGYSFFFILSSGRVFCVLTVKFDRFM
jgi:hypothetical protein